MQKNGYTMHPNYRIVRAHEDEMPVMIEWAKNEGWNPGLNDASCFYQADPNGFFLGKIHDEIVAMGAAVIYDDHFAFCGLYMVSPTHRHQGYGMALTKARLAYVGDRSTGLDGVLEMVPQYKNLGYKIAHPNYRFRLDVTQVEKPKNPELVDARTWPIDEVIAFDAKHFPAKRARFLKAWIEQAGAFSALYIEDGHILGFGVIRPCVQGFRIGPLFAQDYQVAHDLLIYLVSHVENQSVFLDVPACNPNALKLARDFNMHQDFETVRMYRHQKPLVNMHQIFGITSFELG